MKFSLVLCTVGRSAEIGAFFESLVRQNRSDYELILVDQNDDDRLAPVVAAYAGKFPLQHVRSSERGLSRARNLGLKYATGDLVGFPDDDCTYFDDCLNRVAGLFDADATLGGITGYPVADKAAVAVDWRADAVELGRFSVLNRCQEFTIFLRRSAMKSVRFNDGLGVGAGTPWGADEGPDFLIRVIEQGARVVFYPHFYVYHPDKILEITPATLGRAASYARGRGALFRIHRFPLRDVVRGVGRPMGGAVLYLLRGDVMRSRYYATIVRGQLAGLFMPATELERLKQLPVLTGRGTTVTVAADGRHVGQVKFSLIMCTYGRVDEIGAFIESLLRQGRRDCELIVIDQNPDDRLDPIFAKYDSRLRLVRLRTDARGVSRARNIGLNHASGEIAGFPDDDCEYLGGYLDRIADLFDTDAGIGGITGYLTADPKLKLADDYKRGAVDVTKESAPDQSQEFTIFYRRTQAADVRFNQMLGVGGGTPWGADEGPDLVLRLMQHGLRMVYFPELIVYHPDKNAGLTDGALARAASYASGRGCMMRLHHYSMRRKLRVVVRATGGVVVYLAKLQPRRAKYYFGVLTGLLRGLFINRENLAKVAGGAAPVNGGRRPAGKVFSHA